MTRILTLSLASILVTAASGGDARADQGDDGAALQRGFTETVLPFFASYCLSCHGAQKPKAELDLTRYATMDAVIQDHPRWAQLLERLASKDMPPEKAERQPSDSERLAVVGWIEAMRKEEARRNAGDPGVVLARRLSNAEYDHTVRDLTGVDIRPTREFPVDPANEAGFDNSGESLAMSPALVKKYLEAARQVTDHLALT